MIQVTPFSQRDSQWAHVKLGYGIGTIGNFGCLITAIASGLNSKGANITPFSVNEALKKVRGFAGDSKNLVVWSALKQAFPQIKFNGIPQAYDNTLATNMVSQGIPVLVEVNGASIGAVSHWVLYIGEQKMLDPWTGKIEPTTKYPARKLVVWDLQTIEPKQSDDYFLGIDLNNKESIKVCIQTWKDVVDGKYVKKEDSEKLYLKGRSDMKIVIEDFIKKQS